MKIELNMLMEQLQGHWELVNDEQKIKINGNALTVFAKDKSVTTSFQLVRNMQLGNWQIKVLKPVSWLRTFIVDITSDTFMLYDFNPTVNVAMGARSKLLNPSRIFKYIRVV